MSINLYKKKVNTLIQMALLTNLIWPLSSFRQYVLFTQGMFLSTIWSNDTRYEDLDNMDQKHYVKQYALSKPRHV